jgi:DNA-directed RNA polymerase alpha subunit
MPGVRLCDVNGEGYGRALNPLRTALGATAELGDVARFTAAEILKVKGIGPKLIDTIRLMLADHRLHLKGEAPDLAKAA